jgi:hypothetical protein
VERIAIECETSGPECRGPIRTRADEQVDTLPDQRFLLIAREESKVLSLLAYVLEKRLPRLVDPLSMQVHVDVLAETANDSNDFGERRHAESSGEERLDEAHGDKTVVPQDLQLIGKSIVPA